MLYDSRIYSFLHKSKRFSFHLIDGQKIISDYAVLHNITPQALLYFRDTLLSSLQFERLLKVGENLGFHIDSENPFFKFKLELSYNGKFRTMILPKELNAIPHRFTGLSRLAKIQPNQATPYTSITEVNNMMTSEVINNILKKSYQDDSFIHISDNSDHSLMVSKLPQVTSLDDEVIDQTTPHEFFEENKSLFEHIFNNPETDLQGIVDHFENLGFDYLSSKVLKFECPCSRDHYLNILSNLAEDSLEQLIQQPRIDVTCDYCRTSYLYDAQEILQGLRDKTQA